MQDFIARAKAHPEGYNIGTVSIGSGQHMAATLKSLTGLPQTIIPYRATPNLFAAVKSHDVVAAFEVITPALPLLQGGELRALAVSSTHRFPGLPDVPTLQESGVQGYDVIAWNGIAAPAKTPRAIIDRLNHAINAALAQPDVQKRFRELGIEARGGTPEDLRDILAREVDKWNKLVDTAKIERQ